MADDLRVLLGDRIRSARQRAGMSQQVLADAMSKQGFSWRQTTVAKVEASDRPTLFIEVVHLGRILNRDLGFFFNARDELDELVDELEKRTSQLERARIDAQDRLTIIESDYTRSLVEHNLSLRITSYRYSLDSGQLRDTLERLSDSSAFTLQACLPVLQAAGIPRDAIERADHEALRQTAIEAIRAAGLLTRQGLPEEFIRREGSLAHAIAEGSKEVDPRDFEKLRKNHIWRADFMLRIVDLIVEHTSDPRKHRLIAKEG